MKWLLGLLLLANGVYFLGSQGHLTAMGWPAASSGEPERLTRQVRPDTLRLVSSEEAEKIINPPPPPVQNECWVLGPFDEKTSVSVKKNLLALLTPEQFQMDAVTAVASTAGSQASEKSPVVLHWLVYMGRYPDPEMVTKKKGELRARKVAFEPLTQGPFSPGLVLGRYATQAEAQKALDELPSRGVHTAKIGEDKEGSAGPKQATSAASAASNSPAVKTFQVKVPVVSPSTKAALEAAKPVWPGHNWQPC